jgi:chromate transporter
VRGGWWGGLLAGVTFALPGFAVMLALAIASASLGVSPLVRGALYGLGPVVVGIFVAALARLGTNAVRSRTHALIGAGAAAAAILTFGGGIAMIALLEEHLVTHLQWLTPDEFIAELALGQLTPGPVLLVAAYVGYKLLGVGGAVAAAAAVFLPSFVLMLALLPVVDRVRTLAWTRAAIQGVAPAVIGVMAVALARLIPHAAPDPLAMAALVATVIALIVWRLAPVKLMLAGAVLGALRHRV